MPLYVLTQFFDYLGSIINYAAVGGAILYLSKAEGMEEAEISGLIARGSYSCLYLIDAFSQVRQYDARVSAHSSSSFDYNASRSVTRVGAAAAHTSRTAVGHVGANRV